MTMHAIFSRAVVLASCCAMLGCTTVAQLTPPPEGLQQLPLKLSDTVDLKLKSGETKRLTLTRIDTDRLAGTEAGSNQPVQVAAQDIASVEQQRIDGVRTTLLVLAIVLLVAAAVQSAAKGVAESVGRLAGS